MDARTIHALARNTCACTRRRPSVEWNHVRLRERSVIGYRAATQAKKQHIADSVHHHRQRALCHKLVHRPFLLDRTSDHLRRTRHPLHEKVKSSPGTVSVRKINELSGPLPGRRVSPASAGHATATTEALRERGESRQGMSHEVKLFKGGGGKRKQRATPLC